MIVPTPSVPMADAKEIQDRPDVLVGITERIRTGYGNLYITINTHNGRPFEVFAQIGNRVTRSTMAATTQLESAALSRSLCGPVFRFRRSSSNWPVSAASRRSIRMAA